MQYLKNHLLLNIKDEVCLEINSRELFLLDRSCLLTTCDSRALLLFSGTLNLCFIGHFATHRETPYGFMSGFTPVCVQSSHRLLFKYLVVHSWLHVPSRD